ncbi:unnamed protein product, partial [Rotaria sordida]
MMKTYLYLTSFILFYYCGKCAQPYFPPQILFFADNTLYAIDEINQRAYKSASSSVKQSETGYALKHFPFAIPGSPQ